MWEARTLRQILPFAVKPAATEHPNATCYLTVVQHQRICCAFSFRSSHRSSVISLSITAIQNRQMQNCSNFILAHLPFTYRATHTRQMSQLYRPWSPWLLATHDCRVQSSFVSDWMAIYWKIWLDCCISLYRQNGLVCCFGKALRALCVVCRVRCVMCLNTGSLSDDHHHHSILITVQFIFVIPIFLILLFGFCWGFGRLSLRCHCFTLWYACSLAACATNMAS